MKRQELIQKVIDCYVDYMVSMANNNAHGYSQAERSLYSDNPTSFDCSSLTLTAINYAFKKYGIHPTPEEINKKYGLSYTGNMMNLVRHCGFSIVAEAQTAHADLQRGDLELNVTYHVAVAVDKDTIVHARSSEGTRDNKDNSGNEIRTQPWYNYSKGWTHRLRFTGEGIALPDDSEPVKAPEKAPEQQTGKITAKHTAQSFDASAAGTYIVQASELNVRDGAGTDKKILTAIPKGKEVYNYGYYTKLNGSRWMYVEFMKDGILYTGFASEGQNKGYLVKK